MLRESLSYFIAQDYENKELLIFNNDDTELSIDPEYAAPNIRLINGGRFDHVDEAYNEALKHVSEDTKYISIWDDDDIYLPWHLSEGVKKLEETNKILVKPKPLFSLDEGSADWPTIPVVDNTCEGSMIVRADHIRRLRFGNYPGDNRTHPHPVWVDAALNRGGYVETDVASYVYFWVCAERPSTLVSPLYCHQTIGTEEFHRGNTDKTEDVITPLPHFYHWIANHLPEGYAHVSNRLREANIPELGGFETPLNNDISILFVGHDHFTRFTKLAASHFDAREYAPLRMYHASHTKPLGLPNVADILMPKYLQEPVDDGYNYLGKDLYISRMIEVLKMIPTKYVWYVMPDHFYSKLPSLRKITHEYVPCMEYWTLHQLKLHWWASIPQPDNNNQEIHNRHGVVIRYAGGCDYPVSHHATIYNKEWLLDSYLSVAKNGGWSNQDHELSYWVTTNPEKAAQVKKEHSDGLGIAAAYLMPESFAKDVELVSAVKLGKLNEAGKNYLETCELPEAAPLKGINLDETV